MKRGVHGDIHLLSIANDVNLSILASSEVVGGIDEVLDGSDLVVVDSEKNIAFELAEFRGWRLGFHIHHAGD